MGDLKIALLIDGDNISAKYLAGILDELTELGSVTVKRIYGDWTKSNMGSWRDELLACSILPMQQFSNVSGKNATDSALIIDAMDLLYNKDVEAFVIVSSDSDFTRLASRLGESGKVVIGMGEAKTPDSFRNACTRFILLENLVSSSDDLPEQVDLTLRGVEHVIAKAIRDSEESGKPALLSDVGNRLRKKYPDFDVRTFGYSVLSAFIEDIPRFQLARNGNVISVQLADSLPQRKRVEEFAKGFVGSCPKGRVALTELGKRVHREFPDFNLKDTGYSQLSKFVASIDGVDVLRSDNDRMYAASSRG